MSTKNWCNFKTPFEKLDRFTRHMPFPSEELKDTYIDGYRKPKKKDAKLGFKALLKENRNV